MYGSLGTIWSEVGVDYSKMDEGLRHVETSLDQTARTMEQRTREIGQQISDVGKKMSLAFTAPITLIGGQMVRTYASFEDAMARVGTVSGAVGDELQALEEAARSSGETTRYSASEAAMGMEKFALAGFQVHEIVAALPGMLDLAAAGAIDLARAADIVSDVMTVFGEEASETARYADVFATAQARANVTVDMLGESLSYAAAAAAAAGMDLEETTAIIATLGDAGIKGSRAGTALDAMLRDIRSSTEEGKLALGSYLIEVYDVEGEMRSLTDILEDMEAAMAGMTGEQRDAELAAIFQQYALRGVNSIMQLGTRHVRELEAGLRTSEGAASNMATAMEDTLGGALRELRSSYEELSISLAETVGPAFKDLVETITEMVRHVSNLDPEVQKLAVTLAGALAVIGPLLIGVGTLMKTLPALAAVFSGPVGWAILGTAAIVGIGTAAFRRFQSAQEDSIDISEEYFNTAEDTARELEHQADEMDDLIAQFEELNSKTSLSTSEHAELEQIMSRIVELQPAMAQGYTDISEAIDRNVDSLSLYADNLRQQSELERMIAAQRAYIALPELQTTREELEQEAEVLQQKLAPAFEEAMRLNQAYLEIQRLIYEEERAEDWEIKAALREEISRKTEELGYAHGIAFEQVQQDAQGAIEQHERLAHQLDDTRAQLAELDRLIQRAELAIELYADTDGVPDEIDRTIRVQTEQQVEDIALPVLSRDAFQVGLDRVGEDMLVFVQQILHNLGYLEGEIESVADGIFGPMTEEAVQAFQEIVGIEPTGIVDKETWQAFALELQDRGFSIATALRAGIEQGAIEVNEAMVALFEEMEELLPSSDAQRGPLSNLTARGRAIPETIASGLSAGVATLDRAFESMLIQIRLESEMVRITGTIKDVWAELFQAVGDEGREMLHTFYQTFRQLEIYNIGVFRRWQSYFPEMPGLSVPTALFPEFQEGGILPGYGGGDQIPALLEAGEAVIPKESVGQWPELVTALISGNVDLLLEQIQIFDRMAWSIQSLPYQLHDWGLLGERGTQDARTSLVKMGVTNGPVENILKLQTGGIIGTSGQLLHGVPHPEEMIEYLGVPPVEEWEDILSIHGLMKLEDLLAQFLPGLDTEVETASGPRNLLDIPVNVAVVYPEYPYIAQDEDDPYHLLYVLFDDLMWIIRNFQLSFVKAMEPTMHEYMQAVYQQIADRPEYFHDLDLYKAYFDWRGRQKELQDELGFDPGASFDHSRDLYNWMLWIYSVTENIPLYMRDSDYWRIYGVEAEAQSPRDATPTPLREILTGHVHSDMVDPDSTPMWIVGVLGNLLAGYLHAWGEMAPGEVFDPIEVRPELRDEVMPLEEIFARHPAGEVFQEIQAIRARRIQEVEDYLSQADLTDFLEHGFEHFMPYEFILASEHDTTVTQLPYVHREIDELKNIMQASDPILAAEEYLSTVDSLDALRTRYAGGVSSEVLSTIGRMREQLMMATILQDEDQLYRIISDGFPTLAWQGQTALERMAKYLVSFVEHGIFPREIDITGATGQMPNVRGWYDLTEHQVHFPDEDDLPKPSTASHEIMHWWQGEWLGSDLMLAVHTYDMLYNEFIRELRSYELYRAAWVELEAWHFTHFMEDFLSYVTDPGLAAILLDISQEIHDQLVKAAEIEYMEQPERGPRQILVPGLQTGGILPGHGGGDIVPAMLEPGEAIIPKETVSRWPTLIDALIAGGSSNTDGFVQRFQDGGIAQPANWQGLMQAVFGRTDIFTTTDTAHALTVLREYVGELEESLGYWQDKERVLKEMGWLFEDQQDLLDYRKDRLKEISKQWESANEQIRRQHDEYVRLLGVAVPGTAQWISNLRAAADQFDRVIADLNTIRVVSQDLFGPGVGTAIGGLLGAQYAGEAAGTGVTGTGRTIAQIAGGLAGLGVAGPWGAIAAGIGIIGGLVDPGPAPQDALDLEASIDHAREQLQRYQSEIETQQVEIRERTFLLWRTGWDVLGEEAARESLEFANRMLGYMNQAFTALDSSMANTVRRGGTWIDFRQALRQQMEAIVMEELILSEDLKTQARALVGEMVDLIAAGELDESAVERLGEAWEGLFRKLEEGWEEYEDILGAIIPEGEGGIVEHEVRGVQITRLAGRDRDLFIELFRPLQDLVRPDYVTGEMRECYQKFVDAEIGAINAAEVRIDNVYLTTGDISISADSEETVKGLVRNLVDEALRTARGSGGA